MLLILLSPAKKQSPLPLSEEWICSKPEYHKESLEIIEELKSLSLQNLCDQLSISEELANKTRHQIQLHKARIGRETHWPAASLYQGDAFVKLSVNQFTIEDMNWAQDHLRIMSGLYGILRPLDLIQPHRLDVGDKYKYQGRTSLVSYWKDKVTDSLNAMDMKAIVNLTSLEYTRLLDRKKLKPEIVDIVFRVWKDGKLRNMGLYGKQARGAMASELIRQRVIDCDQLKSMAVENFVYAPELSTSKEYCFIRE